MRPVTMLNEHDPDAGVLGDCWRCCIASLLHLPAEAVPNFVEEGAGRWWTATQRWLGERGLAMVLVDLDGCKHHPLMPSGSFCIGSGPSPRGDHGHCVIVDEGLNVVHDPHPSRAGLAGPVKTLEFLVPVLRYPPECDRSGDCPWCRDIGQDPLPCPFDEVGR
jgi:hypothetical protein